MHWLGTRAGMEAQLVPAAGIPISYLRVKGMRGKGVMQKLIAPLLLLEAIVQAMVIIVRLKPSAVLGTGGYVAGPGGIAARLCGLPLILHEQNSVAGTTNRLLARFAKRILLGIPGPFAGNAKAEFVGNPVRGVIAALPARGPVSNDRNLRVLVIGGSQGARVLNQTIPDALALMDASIRPAVVHQSGRNEHDACRQRYLEHKVEAQVVAFVEDMADAYSNADIVICRAGALTVSELAAVGIASILVPLPNAIDDHQRRNARWLADAGAAIVVDQSDFSAQWLADQITHLSQTRSDLDSMALAARSLARPQAAMVVAQTCLEVA